MSVDRAAADRYIPELDSLRAAAVLVVMGWHFSGGAGVLATATVAAVRFFFCLSGFLLTRLLLEDVTAIWRGERTTGWAIGSFYARRTLRIFPIYYLALAVLWIAAEVRRDLAWHASYTLNVRMALTGEWNGATSHLWSLCVEEQFYLLWPLIVLGVSRRALRRMLWAGIAIGPVWRAVMSVMGNDVAGLVMLPGAVDALCMGALLAVERPALPRVAGAGACASLGGGVAWGLAAVLGAGSTARAAFEPFVVSAALVSLLALAASAPTGYVGATLRWLPARALGRVSYGAYLYHNLLPLTGIGAMFAWMHPGGRLGLLVAATMACAALSWVLIEQPILSFKGRLAARRRRPDALFQPAVF
jgi:peptidoglycan/LPS O-acetylase OafA/YrhL